MGYIRHHAIIVTAFSKKKLKIAHKKAIELVGEELVSRMMPSPVNGYYSFFVCPDGSKEGWPESICYDLRRDNFIEWISEEHIFDWAFIQYADEEGQNTIVECS